MKSPILNLESFEATRWVPWRGNTANFLTIHLQARLPYDKPLIRTNYRGNYTTICVCLGPDSIKKLKSLAQNQGKTQSEALRCILDSYFQTIRKKGLSHEPFTKFSPIGLKIVPRTIRKDQDIKLRELAEKTNKNMSELAREAVDIFVESNFAPNN